MVLKQDIQNKDNIKTLVDSFYDDVREDDKIGYIFNDVIGSHWDTHLPIMYDFWASALLGEETYQGRPLKKHLEIDREIPLETIHFNRWIELWRATVDKLFEGDIANMAKVKADNVADMFLTQIHRMRGSH